MIPDNIEKILESQYLRFIDVSPTEENPTWKVVGIGVETDNGATEYNPNVERTKWIIQNSASTDHTSNDKQASFPQKTYKNDPCFEYVNGCRDKLNSSTHVLEVDTWSATGGSYVAKYSNATVVPTSYNGDTLEWDLYYDGDPVNGTVSIAGGVPTFTPSASL